MLQTCNEYLVLKCYFYAYSISVMSCYFHLVTTARKIICSCASPVFTITSNKTTTYYSKKNNQPLLIFSRNQNILVKYINLHQLQLLLCLAPLLFMFEFMSIKIRILNIRKIKHKSNTFLSVLTATALWNVCVYR